MSNIVYSTKKQNTITIAQLMEFMEPGYGVIIAFLVVNKLLSTQQPNNPTTCHIPVNIHCPTTVMMIILTVGNIIKMA